MNECYIPHLDLTLKVGDRIKTENYEHIVKNFAVCPGTCVCCVTKTILVCEEGLTACLCEHIFPINIIEEKTPVVNKIMEI